MFSAPQHCPAGQFSQTSEAHSEEFNLQGHFASRKRRNQNESRASGEMNGWTMEEVEEYSRVEEMYAHQAKRAQLDNPFNSQFNDEETVSKISSVDPGNDDLPEKKMNCKIRIGFVDLFHVESNCIVIPQSGPLDFSNEKLLYNQFLRKVCEDEGEREDFVYFLKESDRDYSDDGVANHQICKIDPKRGLIMKCDLFS